MCGKLGCPATFVGVTHIVLLLLAQVLRVTSGQAEALLDMRKKHLRNLHALYEDRQRLNLQVCAFAYTELNIKDHLAAPALWPVPDACWQCLQSPLSHTDS